MIYLIKRGAVFKGTIGEYMADWNKIKEIWTTGVGSLDDAVREEGVTIPDVFIRARRENWGDRRDAVWAGVEEAMDILSDKDVILAHKTDLGNLRLQASIWLIAIRFEDNVKVKMDCLEKLAKIYNTVIPLERKVFGIEADLEGFLDGVTISKRSKT